jgi:hypothetical protein
LSQAATAARGNIANVAKRRTVMRSSITAERYISSSERVVELHIERGALAAHAVVDHDDRGLIPRDAEARRAPRCGSCWSRCRRADRRATRRGQIGRRSSVTQISSKTSLVDCPVPPSSPAEPPSLSSLLANFRGRVRPMTRAMRLPSASRSEGTRGLPYLWPPPCERC